MNTASPDYAEQATGCQEHPHGLGKFYANGGAKLTAAQAYEELREGRAVHVPNAGASSYHNFFPALGLTVEHEAWDWTSSAGDWTLMIKDGKGGAWYPALQSNRYPRGGFEYAIDFSMGAETKAELMKYLAAY